MDTIVPENWFHAVVNLADSVAISMHSSEVQSSSLAGFKQLQGASDLESTTRFFEALTAEQPVDLDSKVTLSRLLLRTNGEQQQQQQTHQQKAVELLKGVMELDPFRTDALFLLYSWMTTQARYARHTGAPPAPPGGWWQEMNRTLARFEPFLALHGRSMMANMMLANLHQLRHDSPRELRHLERNAHLQASGLWAGAPLSDDFAAILRGARQRHIMLRQEKASEIQIQPSNGGSDDDDDDDDGRRHQRSGEF